MTNHESRYAKYFSEVPEYDPDVFNGKTILLPCDDPEWSNFTKFFAQNFERFGLKKLMSNVKCAELPGDNCGLLLSSLTNLVICEGVRQIKDDAFLACDELLEVSIPFGVTNIGYRAFSSCRKLSKLIIPDTVRTIGEEAFYGCRGIKAVKVSATLKEIGKEAFFNCMELKDVRLPVSLETVGESAFANCTNITTICFPNKFKCNELFPAAYKSVTNAIITAEESEIGNGQFYGCSKLKEVLAEGVITNIGNSAFYACGEMRSLPLISNVVTLGSFALSHCYQLSVELPDCLKEIGDYAMGDCMAIERVVIPEGVTNVGEGAFYCCDRLKDVVFPAGLSVIGERVLSYCSSLTNAVLPDALQVIPEEAFQCCGIELLTVPSSVQKIGDRFVALCGQLRKIVFNNIPPSGTWINDIPSGVEIVYPSRYGDEWAELIPVCDSVTIRPDDETYPEIDATDIEDWIENFLAARYRKEGETIADYCDRFKIKFDDEYSVAFLKRTGKSGQDGEPICVWQDYVAGTDPTDETDAFTALITIVDGLPVISYSPELSPEQSAMRIYKTYGKSKLTDADWLDITDLQNEEKGKFNFFRVSVEMK